METFKLEKTPENQIRCIREFIEEKRKDFQTEFVNPLLREDVLVLLDKYCTVIYYPEPDEQNHGFHVRYPDGSNFVYINTSQTKEKQIFTAAHELGHIWNLDERLRDCVGVLNEEQEERAMNRFAAELLMPQHLFPEFISRQVASYPHQGNAISIKIHEFLQVCLSAMYEYFVPYKAVVIRLFETGFLLQESAEELLKNYSDNSKIGEFLTKTAKVKGYDSRLFQKDERKWIEGLKDLLDSVEKKQNMTSARLNAIRERFGLLRVSAESDELSKPITVEKINTKETENNASEADSCD